MNDHVELLAVLAYMAAWIVIARWAFRLRGRHPWAVGSLLAFGVGVATFAFFQELSALST